MSTISGTVNNGVVLGGGTYTSPLTITATGIVSPAAGIAVYAPSTYVNAAVLNFGEIIGYGGNDGIKFANGGSVNNAGSIQVYGLGLGVNILGALGTATNSGLIRASSDSGVGVVLVAGGIVENTGGSIYGVQGIVIIGADATVTNAGTIVGTGLGDSQAGILLHQGGSVANALLDASACDPAWKINFSAD